MADTCVPCPGCGGSATRKLTTKELRERNDGKDPLVVVRPRICKGCGHVWEPPPSAGMCYVVALPAATGAAVGAVLLAGAVWLLVAAAFMEAGGSNTLKNRIALAGMGLAGLALASGGLAMCRKYLRLGREQSPYLTGGTPVPPEDRKTGGTPGASG